MKPGKIVHLFIAFVLLVSTIGVVINKHYSGGELFSTALFVEAQSCCAVACCHQEPVKDCAEESDYYRLIADYVAPSDTEQNFFKFLIFASIDAFPNDFLKSEALVESLAFVIIKPPPKTTDIPVLFHSLLI